MIDVFRLIQANCVMRACIMANGGEIHDHPQVAVGPSHVQTESKQVKYNIHMLIKCWHNDEHD